MHYVIILRILSGSHNVTSDDLPVRDSGSRTKCKAYFVNFCKSLTTTLVLAGKKITEGIANPIYVGLCLDYHWLRLDDFAMLSSVPGQPRHARGQRNR